MELTADYVSNYQNFNLSMYLNKPNKRGLGMVYVRYRFGGYLFRISTNLKVPKEYWDKETGSIMLRRDRMNRSEWEIYNTINRELNNIHNLAEEKIEEYICKPTPEVSPEGVGMEIARTINNQFRMTKKRPIEKIPLVAQLRGLVLEYDNTKTQSSLLGLLATFEKFLKEKGIEDNITSLNMETMRAWREWIEIKGYSVRRQKDCVGMLFTLASKMERKYGYDFQLDKKKIEPIKDKRTSEEKRENGIALTPGEIEQLRNVDLTGREELIPARDMFLLQCWGGCRFEDIPLLLDSQHIHKEGENWYSTFKTQKKGITSMVPLNSLYPELLGIVEKYKDNCPYIDRSALNKYNTQLKQLAELAGLDREITYNGQRGTETYTEKSPLYSVISSHDGRHTFITNCIREKGLTPDKVKLISGHSDTKLIESTYANLTKDDNREILRKAIEKANDGGKVEPAPSKPKETVEESPTKFALWLVKELGIDVNSTTISLPELADKIADKKGEIISTYGAGRYRKIKELLGVGLREVDKKRLQLLFCKALKHQVTIHGTFRGKKF